MDVHRAPLQKRCTVLDKTDTERADYTKHKVRG